MAAFALTAPEVVVTTSPPSRYVHVPGLGEVPVDPGEQSVTIRFRGPEALLAFGVALAFTASAAYAAYSERELMVRKVIATVGIAYGVGIGLLTYSRKEFRIAAPLLLPVGLTLLALSSVLRWLLERRFNGSTRRRRVRSSRGRPPFYLGPRNRSGAARRGTRRRRHPIFPASGYA